MGWVLKGVGIVAAFVMVAFCAPEIIAPPSAVAGGTHLECNDSTGFVFTEIKSDDTGNIFGGITTHTILGSSMITLPETFDVEKFC
jgi:hypothetical protein